MEDNNLFEISKRAYVLSQQISRLLEAMNKEGALSGYRTYCLNYNSILKQTKEILKMDSTILDTISQLIEFNPNKEHGYAREFQEIKANLNILEAALISFYQFHFSPEEKAKMNFIQ